MKLLVTGGAGYIGGIVTTMLLEAGHEVTVVDDLSTSPRDGVPPGATFVECGLHDVGSVLDPSYDAVLHFAGLIAAGESMTQPGRYWHVNTGGSLALLVAMREAGVSRIVFSSTAAVYGDPESVPIPETARLKPTNVYGDTKLAVDLMLAGSPWLAAVSLRYFNVVGAAYGRGERHAVETHLVPIALQVAAGRRESLTVYGEDYPTPDGTCIRDYVHVGDLAAAHLLALPAPAAGEHRIYNLGNGTGFSVQEVVDAAREVTGHPIPVVVGERRPGDPAQLVASSDLIRAELGWTPEHTDLAGIVRDAWEIARARA
ncbi:MAG TPA: UDP-glucose 4-epimerase GalE [Mycobacteriales bacterium]